MLMNGAWVIFSIEGTEVAAGGLISNIARVISILLAVGLTVWYKRKNECLTTLDGRNQDLMFPDSQ